MKRELKTLMDGLTFGEGPRWYDNKFYFSDFYSHKVYSLDLKGNSEVIVEVPNQPSGLGWRPDETMLIVSMKDRKLLSFKDNILEEEADLSEFAGFHCNDMVVDHSGNAYIGNFGFNTYEGEEIKPTNLILVKPGEDPVIAADDLLFPNGTVITPDDKTLIVGETYAARLTAFDKADDGSLSNRRIWADLKENAVEGLVPLPDGMCLDEEGAIWVASPSTSEVIRVHEGGMVSERIPVETNAFACMLGGEDGKTLFICTSNGSGVDPDSALREKSGKIEIVKVDVPGAGRPLSVLNLFLENFVLIFVAIDPITILPIFATFTKGLNKKDLITLCLRSTLTAFGILLLFWLFGSALLQTMGININSFRIVGGMFLMVIAYQMVFEQRQKRREETVEEVMDDEELSSLATFPIAIPLIAGPGAITLVMLLSEKSGTSIENQIVGFSPIIIVLILNAISLWASGKIAKRLPTSISSALQRTFGLLLGALAIEFVIEGLRQTFSI